MSFACVSLNSFSKLKLIRTNVAISTQLRWKKRTKVHRKPRWMPMAPSKMFNIPEHPVVPPDERELVNELLDEYYRNFISLRKQFQDEISLKPKREEIILAMKDGEEQEFKLLLEENKKENERIKKIREETMEKEFQEKQLQLLQVVEEWQKEQEETKKKVEEIVKVEKVKSQGYITLENIDQAIERAIDNPINISFAIDINGSVIWEGKPPLEYEKEINRRITEGKEA